MLSIQTNINSLIAQQNLNVNNLFQGKTIEQLTSGYRINSSGDDAAGLAVANKFRSSVAELTQGVANANDGVASLQIMDGGINNISQMLDRLKTLAMQSASGSFTGSRAALNSEFQSDVAEIDRQAQSIGLNQGGTFAKNLALYLGAGSGSTQASNSVVTVDLSKSTVDSQSMGLKGVQATDANPYDLGPTSGTSVQNIVAANGGPGITYMTFTGPGFGDSNGIKVAVNMTGVGDVNGLLAAVNSAIQAAGNLPTGAAGAFKTANITATIFTNPAGGQQLAFDASSSAFTVRGDDTMSNALLGSFNGGVAVAAGSTFGTGCSTGSVSLVAGSSFSFGAYLTISGAGMASSVSFAFTAGETVGDAITTIENSATLTAAGITITGGAGAKLIFSSNATFLGDGFEVKFGASTGHDYTMLGLQGGDVAALSKYYSAVSNGAFQLAAGAATTAQPLPWTDQWGGDSQTVTVLASDTSGNTHPLAVTLTSAWNRTGTGSSIDAAINAINNALQGSNDSTLQQVIAVKGQSAGTQTIQFVSTLNSFTVSVGSNSSTGAGLNSTQVAGTTFHSVQAGAGGTADISTVANAQNAVGAISAAVGMLGAAQASVGKGQNQLNFAISLAQSQITNFASAQSIIRDADVAQQAANLTKAQVLEQASIAAMAQANSAPQAVLALLKG